MDALTLYAFAADSVRRARGTRHRGSRVWCPVCNRSFDQFMDFGHPTRPSACCWHCTSLERHRAMCLLLERRPTLLSGARSLLHFAPEPSLQRRLKRHAHLRYVTADLAAPHVDLRLDITAIDLPDASFDAVLCSHVLEHVEDDRAAMRELRRITAPDGWCLVMVPFDLHLQRTYEDPSITDPAARERAFGQNDHVRSYALNDVDERLAASGFNVEHIRVRDELGDQLMGAVGWPATK